MVVKADLAAVPRTTAGLDPGLERDELVRPGREAAGAAEAVELRQDRDERIVGGLVRKIVQLRVWKVAECGSPPVQLEPRATEQQIVQIRDCAVALVCRA